MEARSPAEILAFASDLGVTKAQRKFVSALILSFFAGAYIAFASQGSSMAAYNLLANPETFGLGRVLKGAVFGAGLMMVLIAGAELFTGNMLMVISVMDKKVRVRQMLLSWLLVYVGNLLGSLFIAWMMSQSGLFNSSGGLLGGMTIRIAANKTALPFLSAFLLGIMCNWLVCLAVWMSFGARDIIGKIFIVFFIIGLFVTSAFEHSIANMYYIPAGILAKQNPQWVAMSGVAADALAGLSWKGFFIDNLVPVTLGNMLGGLGLVGVLYRLALGKK